MRVIVVGAGKVGYDIARRLSEEGHDVVLVDKFDENLREAASRLDIMTLDGNGASPAVLEQAGVERADMLIAVTDIDEVNMIACFTAKQYGVGICCARVRDPDYTEAFARRSHRRLGIDRVINPDHLTAQEIVRLLEMPEATYVETFAEGRVTLARVRVGEKSPAAGRSLREADFSGTLVAAVESGERLYIPYGESVLHAGDYVYLLGQSGGMAAVGMVASRQRPPAKNVVIVGGGNLGLRLAKMLSAKARQGGHKVKLIEVDAERCSELAELLPNVLVIHGDGEQIDLLRDELVGEGDAFIAVTGHDHTNVLATMVAKELGVSQAITKISREDYALLAEKAGADAVVVPRLISAGTILQMVRRSSNLVKIAVIEDGKGEVLEFDVGEEAEVIGRRLADLPRLEGALIGAILREESVIIPSGESVIQQGDRVIVVALPEAVPAVMRRFGASSRRA
ncbi:MAG: Trk system potassium transporter TrkA [Firmicutes bacterium]|nr:Trk system potassium transporter TrkA [Bacillota bacterium]MBO2521373.1 Trk system potassium transporter TrkA [Bacillota bacterium]